MYLDHGNTSKSPNPQTTFIVKTRQRRYYLMAPSGEAARIWIDVIFTGAQGYTEYLEWKWGKIMLHMAITFWLTETYKFPFKWQIFRIWQSKFSKIFDKFPPKWVILSCLYIYGNPFYIKYGDVSFLWMAASYFVGIYYLYCI